MSPEIPEWVFALLQTRTGDALSGQPAKSPSAPFLWAPCFTRICLLKSINLQQFPRRFRETRSPHYAPIAPSRQPFTNGGIVAPPQMTLPGPRGVYQLKTL